jgi:subtilisin family serine protease
MAAVLGALALGTTGLTMTASATAAPTASTGSTASTTGAETSYVVLAERGGSAKALASKLEASGAKIVSVNDKVGMVTVTSTDTAFAAKARAMKGVFGAAEEGIVGRAPQDRVKKSDTERPRAQAKAEGMRSSAAGKGNGMKGADPLDDKLWGMDMIRAAEAQKITAGDKRVKVGVIDTGVDASHPDIAPNFDHKLSRNFTTDIPDIDGPCEVESCVDPADVDNGGHGTHVAGTIAAAKNGIGVSGVAPDVSIVNVRAGQDAGYFFVGPTVNALTYSADAGLDVVNMSFYVDPWAYYCQGGAPEDSPEEAAEQDMIIESMSRALNYAHSKNVTMVGALGNSATDLANPGTDSESPNYPEGNAHDRTIDNSSCKDLPVEGPHVIGVSAVGPSERKSYFSNYTTDLTSDEIEVSAPGGDSREYFGTPDYRSPSNLILSSVPENVVKSEGSVDEDGNITEDGEGYVFKDCGIVKGTEQCGYYEYYQGTSMASPHAAGVASLIVSRYGKTDGKAGFGLSADTTREVLMGTARDKACPEPRTFVYPGLPAGYTATCVGDEDFNGFYGDGIIDAYAAVAAKKL